MFSILPFFLIFGAALILSSKNDVERKAREEEEALQLEGEIRQDALLALTADEKYEDYCPHDRACYNISACDLTEEIYKAARKKGIPPEDFLSWMKVGISADGAEKFAKIKFPPKRPVQISSNGEEQREGPPRKEAAKSEEGERAWCEHCGAALLSYKSKCYCYKRQQPLVVDHR